MSEEQVWTSFESNPDMPLQRDDFVATAIGPQSGADGLHSLAAELGLELDSFVFVQSDPSGCSEVEAVCPEVLTLQVPTDPAEIPTWLKHVWAFDRNASST
jgi:predicted enzyme involved in methoxymalonyl-ACP biosynthesis